MSHVEISVVIVSYKNLDIIIDCINSIYKYNDIGDRLETIIVDNSPEDNIYEYVNENFKQVNIIKNNNKGFGQGNNVGAKKAKGKYLLFLNPDTILIEPIFRFAIEKFDNDKSLALFGVKLVDLNFKRNMSFYLIDKHGFLSSQFIKFCNKTDFYFDGKMYIAGANIFVKKELFFDCGMFDESIFMYYEEPDIIKRIKLLNGKTAYFKSKRIIHLEGKASENSTVALIRRLESAKYYSMKYNLDFNKQIKKETRYKYLKLIILKLLRNGKSKVLEEEINVLKKCGKNIGGWH